MTTTPPAQLITACSWCHRIMVNNIATPEPDPMTSNVSHGICRECEAKVRKEEETTLIGYNGTTWVKSK